MDQTLEVTDAVIRKRHQSIAGRVPVSAQIRRKFTGAICREIQKLKSQDNRQRERERDFTRKKFNPIGLFLGNDDKDTECI